MTILLFVLILGILVFVHELGHFAVARWSGVAVEEFGFGFPPRIFGVKRGATTYTINWIPFGGFVRLQGEQEDQAQRADSFVRAPFRKQFAILAAGVVMNAVLAWLLLTITFVAGVTTDPTTIPVNNAARTTPVRVEAIVSDAAPASAAGLATGDRILSVNGQQLLSTDDLIAYAKNANYPVLIFDVLHQNTRRTITVTPRPEQESPRYGLGLQAVTTLSYPWYVAPWYGAQAAATMTQQTIAGFGTLLRDILTTAKVSSDVTGPVGIAVLTGQVAQYGVIATLQFMAVLSVSLAVVNFLPLPALDGGRALFVIIGKLRKKPVDAQVEGIIHTIGFYTLLALIVVLSVRDISRYHILDQVKGLFN